MNGLDNHYANMLADHQRMLDEQAQKEEERDVLKARIIELLEDNHPNELGDLLDMSDTEAFKLVHGIRRDGGGFDPDDWEPEYCGEGQWAIFGKTFSAEWIDEHGDCHAFKTKREANDYIKENIK